MADDTLREAATAYGSRRAGLEQPIILENEGQPLAVILSFDEYRRLKSLAADALDRRAEAWAELDKLFETVHAHSADQDAEQIEQEISAARAAVKRKRRASHSGR